MKDKVYAVWDDLIVRYPLLECCKEDIRASFEIIRDCYSNGKKLLIAGNGGSAADAEHISGELMKSFKLQRPLNDELKRKLEELDPERGKRLSCDLGMTLEALPLVSNSAFATAYNNDVGGSGFFAQQILGYGKKGDVFFGISTSGKSENIIDACLVAKVLGLKIIGLTGESGGLMRNYADSLIRVPETETFKIQELHLPVYHCLCMMVEMFFFGSGQEP